MQCGDALLCRRPPPFGAQESFDSLIDRRIHEHRQDHRRRTIDRHRHRGHRRAQIEARVELLHVVERCDRYAGVAGAAVDVRAQVRILAVQRRRIEGRRQSRRAVTARQVVEATIRLLGTALARKHADRIFFLAPIRIDAARIWITARQVLGENEVAESRPTPRRRRRQLGDLVAGQRLRVVFAGDVSITHLVRVLRLRDLPSRAAASA